MIRSLGWIRRRENQLEHPDRAPRHAGRIRCDICRMASRAGARCRSPLARALPCHLCPAHASSHAPPRSSLPARSDALEAATTRHCILSRSTSLNLLRQTCFFRCLRRASARHRGRSRLAQTEYFLQIHRRARGPVEHAQFDALQVPHHQVRGFVRLTAFERHENRLVIVE